jgi:hypothetical protein
MAYDSADAFATSAFALRPTHIPWNQIQRERRLAFVLSRDHASANQNFIAFALNISQLQY